MNIVVSNVKGGVGKTTTAVYLAGAAAQRGRHPILWSTPIPRGPRPSGTTPSPSTGSS